MKKSELYGMIGSTITLLLLLILLLFIYLPGLKQPEEEGIMVSFGDAIDGSGMVQQPTTTPVATPPPPPSTPPVSATKPSNEDLMKQQDNSVALAEQRRKEQERREQQRQEQQRLEQQRLEQQRIEQERLAAARAEAERKRKEQEAIDRANAAMSGTFGGGGNTGSGTTQGSGTQGNPVGQGSSGGNSWSLSGRSLIGQLARPNYVNNVEGRITVNIRVDAAGNVIGATIGSPTNISDPETRNAAMEAARRTKFSSSSGVSQGSITYNFVLR